MFPLFRVVLVGGLVSLGPVLSSCDKCSDPTPTIETAESERLVGRWELTQTSGGIAGGVTPANPAQLRELLIAASGPISTIGQLSYLLNGAVERTMTYQLRQRPAYLTQKQETYLLDGLFIAQRTATILVLVEDANDGFTYTYARHR